MYQTIRNIWWQLTEILTQILFKNKGGISWHRSMSRGKNKFQSRLQFNDAIKKPDIFHRSALLPLVLFHSWFCSNRTSIFIRLRAQFPEEDEKFTSFDFHSRARTVCPEVLLVDVMSQKQVLDPMPIPEPIPGNDTVLF